MKLKTQRFFKQDFAGMTKFFMMAAIFHMKSVAIGFTAILVTKSAGVNKDQ